MRHDAASSRVRGWLRNVSSGYADTIVGGVVFLVLTPILVHRLGMAAYALWVLGHTVTFYLAFLDLGFGNAQVRYHARFAARGRTEDLRTVVVTSCASLLVAGLVATLLGLGIAFGVPASWLSIAPAQVDDFRLVVLLLAIEMPVSFAAAGVENIYEGANRFDLKNVRSIGLRIATALAEGIAVFQGAGVVELVAIELIAACVRLLVDLIFTARLMPGWWRAKAQFSGRIWRRLRNFAVWTSADEALTEGGAQLDHLIIVALFPLALLTPYSLCTGIAAVMLMAVEPVVETFFPLASGLRANGGSSNLARLLVMGSKAATAIAAPIAVFLAFFGHRVIELWVPEAAADVPVGLMPAIVLDYATSMYLWTATVILVAIGRTRLAVYLTVAELVLGVLLMFVLSPFFGLVGLALASFIANVIVGLFFQIPITARAVGVPLSTLVGSTLGRVAAALVPAVVAALALRSAVEEAGWAMLAGAALVIAAVYGVSLLMIGTRRDERALYLQLLRQR
jgi:O-antigen/teichoic acid export membrane protein